MIPDVYAALAWLESILRRKGDTAWAGARNFRVNADGTLATTGHPEASVRTDA
ncbi:hypothetical protein ACNKHW_16900 [Shigella flexneri]